MSISKIVKPDEELYNIPYMERYPQYFEKQFWKEIYILTDGYFACSVWKGSGRNAEKIYRKSRG